MEEVQRRAYEKNLLYEGRITVAGPGSRRREKVWRYRRFGGPDDVKSAIRFLEPAEVRGVTLLVWNHPDQPAGMWLYTPATARHRRIPHQSRTTRFADTDFTYEDLEIHNIARWRYSDLGEAGEGGEDCWRITAHLSSARPSGFDKTVLWISKQKMTPLRIDRWRGGAVVRRLRMRQLEAHQGIWTPMLIEVEDGSRESVTTLRITDLRYDPPVSEADFTLEAMKDVW